MKKSISILVVVFFIFSILVVSSTPLSAKQKILKVKERKQEQDQWCWAGVSQAVIEYFKKLIKQCKIVNYAWGRGDCCVTPSSPNCNTWNYMFAYKGSIEDILDHWGLDCIPLYTYLTWKQTKNQVNKKNLNLASPDEKRKKIKGYPMIIRYGWYGGGGHFIVIRGYDTNGKKLYLMDPWFTCGYGIFTYKYVKHKDYDHDWTHTLYNINFKK